MAGDHAVINADNASSSWKAIRVSSDSDAVPASVHKSVPGLPAVPVDRRRPVTADPQFLTGVFQQSGSEHFTAEIRQIDTLSGNRLVHVMQLAQRESLAHQSSGDVRRFDFAREAGSWRIPTMVRWSNASSGRWLTGNHLTLSPPAKSIRPSASPTRAQYTMDTIGRPPCERAGSPNV